MGLCALSAAVALSACSPFDRARLAPSADDAAVDDGGDLRPDSSSSGDGDRDASPGDGGQDRDGATSEGPGSGCRKNPSPSAACPEICPETCNGLDDDCDGVIDNGEPDALCSLANATALCIEGACRLAECTGRFRDCDNRVDTGCEASLDDVRTCGSCTNVCDIERAIEGCEDGVCVPIGCEPSFDDCDSDPSTVCETEVVTPSQCGACDAQCELDHAVPDCVDLECVVARCDPGYGDCDARDDNGCEAPLDTLDNCGACEQPCALAACAGGVCSAILCDLPEADCDADGVDCEVDLATDIDNCGACGSRCTFNAATAQNATGVTCSSMRCRSVCSAGFGDCDPDYQNGCETPITTAQHCGACGRNCNTLLSNTASTRCQGGNTCEVVTCDPGFASCDGDHATGCETSTRTVTNCGGCASTGANELCTGLPNATATACTGGTCTITTCANGYANCDGIAANGCERNTALDGPCLPDNNCTRRTFGDNTYYFCTNNNTWASARDKCRTQRRSDLVRIDDAAEASFVQMHRVADAWIGGSDLGVEGTFRWVRDGVPFWRGNASGAAVLNQYTRWSGGQPDDFQSNEDCVEVYADGTWNDQNCTLTRDFVCEETPDLCPSDDTKLAPGQCGCGVPDTDADGDGFASCNDGCPSDPNKIAPGTCGCGVSEADTDNDGTPNCNDGCPSDPSKTAPGTCGCGVSEADTDGDGTPNCNDGCPLNPSSTSAATGCGLGYVPSNLDVSRLNPHVADATTTIGCAAVLNTSNTPSFTTWCSGTRPQLTVHAQAGGPELVVVALRDLSIPAGGSLSIVGTRPAALVVFGNATIGGSIVASASGTTANAGGNFSCGTAAGVNVPSCGNETGGGGGGGFGTAGGRGGNGDDCNGGNGGLARGNASLIPLLGGCNGGNGGGCTTRGAGGGALQLSVSGSFTITGAIRANGGVGPNTCGSQYGGAGGGSGGGLRIEAASLTTTGATIEARGGNGGTGRNGSPGSGSSASGSLGGNGGNDSAGGGGGGGGGYGRVVLCNRTTNAGCP